MEDEGLARFVLGDGEWSMKQLGLYAMTGSEEASAVVCPEKDRQRFGGVLLLRCFLTWDVLWNVFLICSALGMVFWAFFRLIGLFLGRESF